MGCVNSRTDINDVYPNIFQVMNVDDQGNLTTSELRLEVTKLDIILYQRNKQPIRWPLRCLRRYGHDESIFSFESGRRCSTGSGIFAFKCQRAERLFNLVQTNIQQVYNNSETHYHRDDTLPRDLPAGSHPSVTRTIPEPNPSDLRRDMIYRIDTFKQQNGIGRLVSVESNSGPISPQGTIGSPSPPPMMQPLLPPISESFLYVNEKMLSPIHLEMERNNNKSLERVTQRSPQFAATTIDNPISNGLMDTESISIQHGAESNDEATSPMAPYMNIDICNEVDPIMSTHSIPETPPSKIPLGWYFPPKEENNETNGSEHVYMNISPRQEHVDNVAVKMQPLPLYISQSDVEEGSKHSAVYANLEASKIENLRQRYSGNSVTEKSPLLPSTLTACVIREVNYAVLDLDKKDVSTLTGTSDNNTVNTTANNIANNTTPSPPESPDKPQKGYATIDFNKTAALSHSVNPNLVNDNEGSRKTRHNSTINDLAEPCRHNSSVSE